MGGLEARRAHLRRAPPDGSIYRSAPVLAWWSRSWVSANFHRCARRRPIRSCPRSRPERWVGVRLSTGLRVVGCSGS